MFSRMFCTWIKKKNLFISWIIKKLIKFLSLTANGQSDGSIDRADLNLSAVSQSGTPKKSNLSDQEEDQSASSDSDDSMDNDELGKIF